ncbi:hypothetical protein EZY14_007505 [Kordia sp. TARA_039_SRF]|nr:hypothetical protein EZY14_007505 [Kordia sp. TARA_039_SRF]
MRVPDVIAMQFKKPTSLSDTFKGYYDVSGNGWSPEFLSSDQTYAISNGDTLVNRFRIILKDASFYSVPYSLLPILIYTGEKLIIKSYGVHISLFGKGLSIIENHIGNQTLLYVRESVSGINLEEKDVFVSRITIEGKNVSTDISEEEI